MYEPTTKDPLMKKLIILALTTLISATSLAGGSPYLDCTDKLDATNTLKIQSGLPGEGGNGVLIQYPFQQAKNQIVTKEYNLKWTSAGGVGPGRNVITRGYSNQSYGVKKHNEKNILHNLEIIYFYDKNDEKVELVEATLVKALSMIRKDYKELYTDAMATNYTCVEKN